MVIDPFRPGLRFPSADDREFDIQTTRHLEATRQAFDLATVFVITLGLTEVWVSRSDGAAFPAAPGTVAGEFNPDRHVLHNLTVDEVVDDLTAFVDILRATNPSLRFIVTVSPVPLVATATKEHVVTASMRSKSILRVAADRFADQVPSCRYFPSYEIIAGPQAPHDYFEDDRRNVSERGVSVVMHTLLGKLIGQASGPSIRPPGFGTEVSGSRSRESTLSQRVVSAECDEVLAES
jgi:hypothetical protein